MGERQRGGYAQEGRHYNILHNSTYLTLASRVLVLHAMSPCRFDFPLVSYIVPNQDRYVILQ